MAEQNPLPTSHTQQSEDRCGLSHHDFPLPCKIAYGNLADDVFNYENMCILVGQNSVSTKNFGSTRDVCWKYPYANVTSKRIPNLYGIAEEASRSREGTIEIRSPPLYILGPTVVTLITQYGIGKSVEENTYAQRIIKSCTDDHHVNKLKCDTNENRLKNFKECLTTLSDELLSKYCDYISAVVIPGGIGRSGRLDEVWLCQYLPLIGEFAINIRPTGKDVILACNSSYMRIMEEKYIKDTQKSKASVFSFKKLKCLPQADPRQYIPSQKILRSDSY